MRVQTTDERDQGRSLPSADRGEPQGQLGPEPQESATTRSRWWRLRLRLPKGRGIPDRWVARQQRRRRLRLVAFLAVIALIAAAVWTVFYSSVLSVRDIRVVGLSEEGQVAGSEQVQNAAGITPGTPIALVEADRAAERIGELPWVDTVEVRRGWPDSIVLAVTERVPVAVVESDDPFDRDGDPIRQGVDAGGVVFDPPGGLWLTDPVIRGEVRAIPEAVAVVASLPEDIERRVREVQAVSPDDIRLLLGNDAIVRWGNAQEAEFKAEVLASLLPRRARGYDVSAPQLPTTFGERGPKDE